MKHDPENLHLPAPEPGLPEHPAFATDQETEDYWRGVSNGLRMAAASSVTLVGAPPEDAQSGPRVRRARVDGLSGIKQAVFLESYAEGLTVEEAAARAEISVSAIYNFANRAAGRAFAVAWDAASHRRRRRFADHLADRSLKGQAEAYREDERLVIAVSEEFEELLDIIEAEGDAEAFVISRTPVEDGYRPQERLPEADRDRMARYHLFLSPEEKARLPDRDHDPYPDGAREGAEAPDDDDGNPPRAKSSSRT